MKFPVRSLNRLCAAYDRLGNSSTIVDFQAMDRWYARAEQVMEACFPAAASDGQIRIALCRCLTCYFYQPCPDREDPWFAYLTATADAWAAAFSSRLLSRPGLGRTPPGRSPGTHRGDEPHLLYVARPFARCPAAPGLLLLCTADGQPWTSLSLRPQSVEYSPRGR